MSMNPYVRYMDAQEQPQRRREPLTASQHILHLLLTVFTFGLWIPVWIIRAAAGNVACPPRGAGGPSSVYDRRFRGLPPDEIRRIMTREGGQS